ncbi:DUF881 domain-containing protein [Modestobacter sp. VKM Ac-2986]|uniref:DUF881 domain-containing protein n=1 Tax=Modestobacter sp. VKM Ac-2986 TaxID=3004140 RepID=UPI0022AA5020|nr:DUF881 domain-containing protein [Modestobacter sp. VKM Ac-2986]MCZ2828891.1 DUF881 domain-containing protein [Modestobacter sp. VKM Ac-2986]
MSAPAPGRQRSLGASLLDQVLAETLDPAYAQAAAARAERAAAPGTGAARPSWLLRHRGQLLVALTLLLAGLLASVTYQEAAVGAQGREQTREALRDDIREESEVTDDLVAELEALTAEVGRTRDQALATTGTGQRALARLTAVEQAAAVLAVSGPGLRVTLDDAPPPADSDPVGGTTPQNAAGLVQDADVQLAVNGLWAAGAEAISINGQRIGATTAIRQAGGAVLVNFRPVAPPYDIEAIGDSEALPRAFLASPEADTLARLTLDYGVVFDFARVGDLDLPAGSSAELRHARPLDPALDPSTAARTDPTTDGG